VPKDLEEIFSSFFGAVFALFNKIFAGPDGALATIRETSP
jgi:hypothetical protein